MFYMLAIGGRKLQQKGRIYLLMVGTYKIVKIMIIPLVSVGWGAICVYTERNIILDYQGFSIWCSSSLL
jgi:hypothetical protein